MDEKKAHKKVGQSSNFNFNDNSTHNQRLKLLDWLFEKGAISTTQARDYLDIMFLASRIMELRQAGYQIQSIWDSLISVHGIKHRVVRYVLMQKLPLDCEVQK